jgi:hypothetical protein
MKCETIKPTKIPAYAVIVNITLISLPAISFYIEAIYG